ncbi:MAG: hypothetical protein H6935_02330 [Thiobacillus sp.]|nr:hypothetical protein [Thiobacillus sp.]
MSVYLVTIGLILLIMLAGIVVDRYYKLFARRHPELGPFRKEGGACGGHCGSGGCGGNACDTKNT